MRMIVGLYLEYWAGNLRLLTHHNTSDSMASHAEKSSFQLCHYLGRTQLTLEMNKTSPHDARLPRSIFIRDSRS